MSTRSRTGLTAGLCALALAVPGHAAYFSESPFPSSQGFVLTTFMQLITFNSVVQIHNGLDVAISGYTADVHLPIPNSKLARYVAHGDQGAGEFFWFAAPGGGTTEIFGIGHLTVTTPPIAIGSSYDNSRQFATSGVGNYAPHLEILFVDNYIDGAIPGVNERQVDLSNPITNGFGSASWSADAEKPKIDLTPTFSGGPLPLQRTAILATHDTYSSGGPKVGIYRVRIWYIDDFGTANEGANVQFEEYLTPGGTLLNANETYFWYDGSSSTNGSYYIYKIVFNTYSIGFNPDRTLIAVYDARGNIAQWPDPSTNTTVRNLAVRREGDARVVSWNGPAPSSQGRFDLWRGTACARTGRVNSGPIIPVATAADGSFLYEVIDTETGSNPTYALTITVAGGDCRIVGTVGVESESASRLLYASPNPMLGSLTIHVSSPAARSLDIFDVRGRRVRSLPRPIPTSPVTWDGVSTSGSSAPAGTYFVVLQLPGRVVTSKIVKRQ